jgi:5-methylthioribose kinase
MYIADNLERSMAVEVNLDFLLDVTNLNGLNDHLRKRGFLQENEKVVHLSIAGEGNMNVVLRAETANRSFVLKQSRPWVNRFPTVVAPLNRIEREYQFYDTVRKNEVIRNYTPDIYHFDQANYLLIMEDFGSANDFMSIYQEDVVISKKDMADVARVVSELHFVFKDLEDSNVFRNTEMRKLNHQHIFVLPLEANNGFDLDAVQMGLQSASDKFRSDVRLKKMAAALGEVYLSNNGTRLLHGDYYPGSWLSTDKGFRMIDPEFGFVGRPEFELGVTVAHLKMAKQTDGLIKDIFVYYHFDSKFDGSLFSKFAGMEIIRRVIGLAQLPLEMTLKERLSLLDEAHDLILNG